MITTERNDEIDKILYSIANFYTKRGEEGYKLDGSDYIGVDEAREAIQRLMVEAKMEAVDKFGNGSWHRTPEENESYFHETIGKFQASLNNKQELK